MGTPTEPALDLGYRGISFSVRGFGVYMVMAVLCIVASNFYAGYRIEQAVSALASMVTRQHGELQTAQDRTSCMLTLTPEERILFRRDYAPGAFRRWCGWVLE